jgi:XRE family transcriptional regulator, regulator of sulfur utilization
VVLGQVIRELRLQVDLTQEALAHRADLTVGQVSRIEHGRSNPHWLTVMKIAYGLGVPLSDLAAREEALAVQAKSGGTVSR